jgi:hypothetical protein
LLQLRTLKTTTIPLSPVCTKPQLGSDVIEGAFMQYQECRRRFN